MRKALVFIIVFSLNSLLPFFAYSANPTAVTVDLAVDQTIEVFSNIVVNPQYVEVGYEANITVTIYDSQGNPLSDHPITIFAEGNPSGVIFTQPTANTDANGQAFGKVVSSVPGSFKIRAIDNYQNRNILLTNYVFFYV